MGGRGSGRAVFSFPAQRELRPPGCAIVTVARKVPDTFFCTSRGPFADT
jgi:hypothetical protein